MPRWTEGTRHAVLTPTGCAGNKAPAYPGPHISRKAGGSYGERVRKLVAHSSQSLEHLGHMEALRRALCSLRKSRRS